MEITFDFILKLFTYFVIYSFGGWILESVFKTILFRKPVNSGFLFGPFCPIYGIGAIIMFLFLKDFAQNPALVFIMGFVVLSIWEYAVGLALEKLFKTKYWDYTENKFNIQGRVCLFNSLIWGVLGIVFIYFIHPFVESKIELIPQNILLYLNVLIYLYLIVDETLSIIRVKNIDIKIRNLGEISDKIKEKLEELKEMGTNVANKQVNKESLQMVIEDLKKKQNKLNRRLERQLIRLKRAFPTMKADNITQFLNQKVESIKEKSRKSKEK